MSGLGRFRDELGMGVVLGLSLTLAPFEGALPKGRVG